MAIKQSSKGSSKLETISERESLRFIKVERVLVNGGPQVIKLPEVPKGMERYLILLNVYPVRGGELHIFDFYYGSKRAKFQVDYEGTKIRQGIYYKIPADLNEMVYQP